MKLLYELSAEDELLVRPHLCGEDIMFCLPFDLSFSGEYTDGHVVVTRSRLIALMDGKITGVYTICPETKMEAVELNSSGCFEITDASGTVALCHYSMEHLPKFAYLSRIVEDFNELGHTHVTSDDDDVHSVCPKCGSLMRRGTKLCTKCADKRGIIKRIALVAKPCLKYYLVLLCIMAASAVILLVNPAVTKNLTNDILDPATRLSLPESEMFTKFVGYIALIAALSVSTVCLNVLQETISVIVSSRLARDLRSMVYEKIQGLSISFLDNQQVGDLMNRVNHDTNQLQNFIQQIGAQGLAQMILLVAITVMLFVTNWVMALLVLVPVPFMLYIVRKFRRQMHKRYRVQWRRLDKMNSTLNDILRGIRVVKAFGQEKRAIESFCSDAETVRDVTVKNEVFYFCLGTALNYLVTFGGYFITLYCGSKVMKQDMTIGELMQFTTYAQYFYQRMNWMSSLPRMFANAFTSAQRIFELMDEKPESAIDDPSSAQEMDGDFEFSGMTFGYKSYHSVLKNINLKVKKGEMIGLVGHSGAGKSTMINLLMRLYGPDEGKITVGGKDIGSFDLAEYKSKLGIVLQQTYLFSGSILENIRYAKPDATLDEVILAAKIANAHDFIVRFPDGYDTRVGERGQRLSGGERQRIALARAVIKNPSVMILDEATASVDTETEQQIQEALARVVKDRTTFAIAHRLSTLKNADRIVVLDHGKIAEIGTHRELIEKEGIYYGLVKAQTQMSALPAPGRGRGPGGPGHGPGPGGPR